MVPSPHPPVTVTTRSTIAVGDTAVVMEEVYAAVVIEEVVGMGAATAVTVTAMVCAVTDATTRVEADMVVEEEDDDTASMRGSMEDDDTADTAVVMARSKQRDQRMITMWTDRITISSKYRLVSERELRKSPKSTSKLKAVSSMLPKPLFIS
jgi:hypothetical protein